MATLGTLIVRVTADVKQAMGGLGAVDKKAKGTATALSGFGKIAAGAFALIAAAATKMAIDFEKSMSAVATLIPGNEARIKELGTTVEQMAVKFGKSTSDLASGLYQTVSAFGDSAESAKRLEIATKAATAGFSTTEEAVALLSAVTKGYGDTSAAALKKVSDLSFLTVKLGQTTFPELAASIGKTVPAAATLGVEVEELMAGFATLTGVTGSTAEVSTQLAGIFRSFIKPTEDMKQAIEKLGYEGGKALLSDKGFVGALKAVIGTTDGSIESVGKLVAEAEAMTSVFALTGSQAGTFNEKLAEMAKAAGTTNEAFAEVAKTTDFKLKQALEAGSQALRELGEAIAPIVEILATGLVPALQAIGTVIDVILTPIKKLSQAFDDLGTSMDGIGRFAQENPELMKWLQGGGGAVKGGRGLAPGITRSWEEIITGEIDQRKNLIVLIKKGLGWIVKETKAYKIRTQVASEWSTASRQMWNQFFTNVHKGMTGLTEYGKAQKKAKEEAEKAEKEFARLAKTLHENIRQALGMKTEWADLVKTMETVSGILQDIWETFRKPPPTTALTDFVKFFSDALPDAIRSSWNLKVAPMLARLKPPDKMKESFAASMEEAFISGFDRALHNIGDLWKAFVIGLGDALAAQLSKALGSSFLGKIGGAIGGQLIGSLFSWIGGLFGGGKSKAEKEMERRAAAEKAAADAARLYAERLAAANQAIADAVLQLQALAIQIPTMAAGIVSGIISRRRMAREIRPLRRQLRRAFGTQVSFGFDPETEQDVERRTGLQKLLRQFGGKRDIIDIKEFRQLLAFAKQQGATPEQIRMLENLVEQLNTRALINIQIQNQKKLLREAEKERDLLKRNLPRMRELLREIERNTRKRGGGKGGGRRGDGDDEELPPPKSLSSLEFMIDSGRSRFSRQSIRRL